MVELPHVYEIDLTKKYILSFPQKLTVNDFARIKHEIDEWLRSDKPFLLIDEDVRLVLVETEDQPSPSPSQREGGKSEE